MTTTIEMSSHIVEKAAQSNDAASVVSSMYKLDVGTTNGRNHTAYPGVSKPLARRLLRV